MPEDSGAQHEVSQSSQHGRHRTADADNSPNVPLSSSPDNEPLYPASLLNDLRLADRANESVRVALMRQVQQTYGNRALQRQLATHDQNAGNGYPERAIQSW